MRIVMITHEPESFGTYQRCYGLAQPLARRGCQVTVICAGSKDQPKAIVQEEVESNLRRVTLRSFATPGVVDRRYFVDDVRRGFLATFALMRLNYNVLHAFSVALCSVAIPTLATRLIHHRRLVIDWCDDYSEGMAGSHHPLIHRTVGMLETKTLRFADRVTVISEYLEERALRCGISSDRICKVWNGLNVDNFPSVSKAEARTQLGLPHDVPIVVSAGNSWTGGMTLLFQAMKKVAQSQPSVRLLTIGHADVPTGTKWEPTQQAYEVVRENVHLIGRQSRERVFLYLCAADAVVMPMEESIADRARIPLRLGEFLACGRPVVCNAVGDTKEILSRHPNGFVCEPDDVNGFATLLLDALQRWADFARRSTAEVGSLPTWEDNATLLLEQVYNATPNKSPALVIG
jgi:glycosyltransferase involved in cell wall biosynthesis